MKQSGETTGDLLDTAVDIQETWAAQQQENGMILPHFERYAECARPDQKGALCQGWQPETCNLGWGASEMAKIYALLKENGLEKPEFLRFATRICDFFCGPLQRGMGALASCGACRGEALDTTGSVGGFILNALIDTWRVTKRQEYLKTAATALDFYMERDVNHFRCMAGAIDCEAVDKETAFPFVVSALDLYEITGDEKYLEYAQKAAYYFFSWAFQYDALYPDTSDFSRYGYSTQGGTAISAEHHAIDPWGALLTPGICPPVETYGTAALAFVGADDVGSIPAGHYGTGGREGPWPAQTSWQPERRVFPMPVDQIPA